MKISKKTKIAIISFVVLGAAGVGALKLKAYIDKKTKCKSKKQNVLKVLFEIPNDLK
tara:strand:- start:1861 stop:2031 length:171 start_codon:yes stop_codon:yes gene_type:complete